MAIGVYDGFRYVYADGSAVAAQDPVPDELWADYGRRGGILHVPVCSVYLFAEAVRGRYCIKRSEGIKYR